jgi:pimeloyl-ACP methyl ester carboxylesterase
MIYGAVEALLGELGYTDVCSLDLPSIGTDPPPANRDADIATIRSATTERLQQGKDVLILGHSYSGVPMSEAVEGLPSKSEPVATDEPNQSGAVAGLVYISCLIMPVGEAIVKDEEDHLPHWIVRDGPKFYLNPDREVIIDAFYNNLEPSVGEYWHQQLAPHQSAACMMEQARYAPWKGDFKCTYVFCEEDQGLPPAAQMGMMSREGAVFEVVKGAVDHCPMLSRPEFVVDVIRKATGDIDAGEK